MSTEKYSKSYADSLDAESRLKNIIGTFEHGKKSARWAVMMLLGATDGEPEARREKVKVFIVKFAGTQKNELLSELLATKASDIAG